MPYDDIRFSHWDDPDDDEFEEDEGFWDDPEDDATEVDYPCESECVMCGKERCLNSGGYCSQCWQIWNS